MPTKTGKTYSSFYGNDLAMDQAGNTGVDATIRRVVDGFGNSTAISLSDDNLLVKPRADNMTITFSVQNTAGNGVFVVDTINSKVLVGTSQIAANTSIAHFGVNSYDAIWDDSLADTHYAVPFANVGTGAGHAIAGLAMGSSTSSSFNDTNPATSLTITATAMNMVMTYWYVMDDITIDAVRWFHGADTATGDSTAAHLMSYAVDIDNGSTGGDLSSGVVVADGATITNAGYEQIYYQSMTIQSADVDAGRVILFTFASDTVSSDYSINAVCKYHIR